MKKVIVMMAFIFLNTVCVISAYTPSEVLDNENKEKIESAFDDAGIEYDALDLIEKLNNGDFDLEYHNVLSYVKTIVSREFRDNFKIFSYVFVLVMLSSLMENLRFYSKNDDVLKMIVLSVILLNLVGVVYEIAEYSLGIIDRLIIFINSMIPTLTALLAASGKIGTSGTFNPLMLGVSAVISSIVKSFVVPVSLIGMALRLVGEFSGKEYLKNFGDQVYKILKWMLGLMVTLYVGIISIVGVAAPKVDEITLKTTKYAVGSFIPYVGGMVADSVDLVLECTTVVKNSVGIAGLVGILLLVSSPCIKIAVKVMCISLLSVLTSAISDKTITNSINCVSSCLGVLLSMNIVVAVMYLLSIAVIIFAGGA